MKQAGRLFAVLTFLLLAGRPADDPNALADLPDQPPELEQPRDDGEQQGEEDKPLLSEVLNAEENEEEAADFKNLYTDFKSKRLKAAFEAKRNEVLSLLLGHVGLIENDTSLVKAEKGLRIEALNITMKHVNNTYNTYLKSTNELQGVLESDFTTFEAVVEWQHRLSEEQRKKIAALQVQAMREHAALAKLEENQENLEALKSAQDPLRLDKISGLLHHVDGTADALQQFLNDHAFLKAQHVKDASLITVVKIQKKSEEIPVASEEKRPKDKHGMTWLIDADNNQFVLTRPADTTELLEDPGLLNDLLRLVIACFIAGSICTSLSLPAFVGYVFAGTLLGPAGLNIVTTIVQITTIGEIGVFLVLFTLGMEFSLAKLREMFRTAVVGGTLYMLSVIFVIVLVGIFLQRPFAETLFVGIIVSLSSTTVAANNLTHSEHDAPHGRGLLGVLLMQDVYLGLVVAATPMLASFDSISLVDILMLTLKLAGSFLLLALLTALITKFVVERLLHHMQRLDETTQLLAVLSICFAILKLTERMEVSMELGCFLAGLMFSMCEGKVRPTTKVIGADPASPRVHAPVHAPSSIHQLLRLVDPVKDLFLAIFFASVGMHVYPTFLATNAYLLFILTTAIVVVKYLCGVAVLKFVLHAVDARTAHVMSVGMAQVSEFAFVLASRGRRLGVLSQPIYFLLLSVTSVTLLVAPLLWAAVASSRRSLMPKSATIAT